MPALVEALRAVTGVGTVVKNAGGRTRGLEGLGEDSAVVAGRLDGPVAVPMNGAIYFADLAAGQKTGLYYDQRPNHAFAARLGRGRSVLDVFTHVGGFALAALAAGAEAALAIDGSGPALELAARGAEASGVAARLEVKRADAFDAMAALGAEGRRFGLVVCDPPAFAPNKGALEAGLRAYERVARLAAALVEADGFLVLCSCSHAADLARFREASLRGVGRPGGRGRSCTPAARARTIRCTRSWRRPPISRRWSSARVSRARSDGSSRSSRRDRASRSAFAGGPDAAAQAVAIATEGAAARHRADRTPRWPSIFTARRSFERQEHPALEQLPDHAVRLGVRPVAAQQRVQPGIRAALFTGAGQPGLTGLGVPVFVRAAGMGGIVGAHRGVADEDGAP